MNHYERLKVNPDAPIEVIRAAYRALAAKHHPDRHMQPGTSHGDMVALNAAYEVLADPESRAAYDAELAEAAESAATPDTGPPSRLQTLWRSTMGFGQTEAPGAASPGHEQDESRVDVQWQSPVPLETSPWLQKKRLAMLGVGAGGLALVVGGWWMHLTLVQIEAEQTLSQHYGGQSAAATGATLAAKVAPSASAVVSMTDEELLSELSALTGQAVTPSGRVNQHLLDGSPLTLRADTQLVDPLALPGLAKPPHP